MHNTRLLIYIAQFKHICYNKDTDKVRQHFSKGGKSMKCKKLKSILSASLVALMLCGTSITAFAAEDATPAAPNDSLPSMELPATIANWSEDIKTITGGTLTANVWLDSLFVNDLIDYQVSAHYNKTDHKNIRTEWWCVVESESLTHSVTVTLNVNPPGVSVSATTSSTTTQATTPHKYYKNTKSQKDASYRSNIALQGNWKKVTMVNEASVWGGSVTKKAAITTQTSVSS